MNLDDREMRQRLDPTQAVEAIWAMPERLLAGWEAGKALPLPEAASVERIALVGPGEGAAAVDLLAAYAAPECAVPVVTMEEGPLPGWMRGEGTLAVLAGGSTPGLAAAAQARGCRALAVEQDDGGMPGILGRLLAAFYRLGLLPGAEEDVLEAAAALRAQRETLGPESPVARNPAKREAGQLMGRWVVVFGPGLLAPAARYWKAQLNAAARTLAQVETLAGADRCAPGGLDHPEALLSQVIALFLQAPSLPERTRARLDYTRQVYMAQGMNTDFIDARGSGRLAHLLTLAQFGSYTAYYLAMAYGTSPAPAEVLAALEEELEQFSAFH